MVPKLSSVVILVFTLSCGDENASTSASTSSTTSTTTSADSSTTSAVPTTTSTTGATTGGTAGASTSSDTGGSGSEAACLAWYEAYTDSFRPLCECDVANGFFETVEECLATATSAPDCMCEVFGGFPESEGMLECYEKADRDLVACLEALGPCPDGAPLQNCSDLEAAAIDACGFPADEVCESIFSSCGESAPFSVCAPP